MGVHSEMPGRGSGKGTGVWDPGQRRLPASGLCWDHVRNPGYFSLPPQSQTLPSAPRAPLPSSSLSLQEQTHQAPALANLDQGRPGSAGLAEAWLGHAPHSVRRGPLWSKGRPCARPGRLGAAAPGAEPPGAESRAGRDQPRGRLPCEERRTSRRCQGAGAATEGCRENQLEQLGRRLGRPGRRLGRGLPGGCRAAPGGSLTSLGVMGRAGAGACMG